VSGACQVAPGYVTRNSRPNAVVSLALQIGLAIAQRDGSQLPAPSTSSAGSLSGEVIRRQQQLTVREVGLMNEHIIKIDQIEDGQVVLAIPSLRVIVIGRTLEEARAWATSSIAYRGPSRSQRAVPSAATEEAVQPPASNAA
jgi:hypothetical protein